MISTLPPDDEPPDAPPDDEAPPHPDSAMHAAATAAAPVIKPLFHFMSLHSFVIGAMGGQPPIGSFWLTLHRHCLVVIPSRYRAVNFLSTLITF